MQSLQIGTLKERLAQIFSGELENEMMYWRKKLCSFIFYFFSICGGAIYIPSTVFAIKDGLYIIVLVNTLVYLFCILITFIKSINYRLRAVLGTLMFYLLGTVLLLILGPSGAGGYWLFTAIFVSALLLGNAGAFSTAVVCSITMFAIYFMIRFEILDWAVRYNMLHVNWLVKTINFAFLNLVIVIANSIFIRGFISVLENATQTRNASIIGLAKLAEHRDTDTGDHLKRIQQYSVLLAEELAESPAYKGYITHEYILDLELSSILHDIGKVGIQDAILLKPGKLTDDEFDEIKKHPEIGGSVIKEIEKNINRRSLYDLGKEIALYHHEKWDGSGYPEGLSGKDIPLSARIVALADVYDALTTKRPYKEALAHDETVKIIIRGTGSHFDPDIVDAFLNVSDQFEQLRTQPRSEASHSHKV